MDPKDKAHIVRNYESLLERHGDSPRSVQWRDEKTQDVRFRMISEVDNLRNRKILDFGCGKGDLYYYLKAKGIETDYVGYDISPKMIEFARSKNPSLKVFCRDIFEQKIEELFDYALISGTFNNKISDNWGFLFEALAALWPHVREGVAFNLLTSYVDYEDAGLFYADPRVVIDWVKKNMSRFLVLRNDYLPFEYTVYIYKRGRGLSEGASS